MLERLLFVLLFTCTVPAYAESTLWVPDKMIAGEQYHGVFISKEASDTDSLVFLSVNDDLVSVPSSTSMQSFKNHAIFPITPLYEGYTEIFAAHKSELYSKSVTVFSPQSKSDSLDIILAANKTKTDTVPAYVIIRDQNGLPVIVTQDTLINFATVGALSAPEKIILKNGTSSSFFEIRVSGTGSIIASSDGLDSDKADIEKIYDEFTVHIAVAPDVALPDSFVYYYVWLEADGRPFRPPYVVDAVVHSGNSDVGRFDANPLIDNDNGLRISLIDGVARGILYTGAPGYAIVTASADGFGSAQDDLFVGSARFDLENNSVNLSEQDLLNANHTIESESNLLLSWIYPPVTDGKAWMVVASYHSTTSKLLYADDDTLVTENTVIVPTISESIVNVSSEPGLEHDTTYPLTSQITKTSGIEFELFGVDHGTHNVTISGNNVSPAASTIDIVPNHIHDFVLNITAIPIPADDPQGDLALVYMADETGAMIDVYDMIGRHPEFLIFADSTKLTDRQLRLANSGYATISGKIEGPVDVTVTLDKVGSITKTLYAGSPNTSLEILAPENIHAGENFPFAIHELNKSGFPIKKAQGLRIFSPDILVTDELIQVQTAGTSKLSVISDTVGVAEYEFSGFVNPLEVYLNLEKNLYRIGEQIVLKIDSTVTASYDLITELPFEKDSDDTFLLLPDSEIDSAVIKVVAKKDGYETAYDSETITVKRIHSVDISVQDSEGMELEIPLYVTIDEKDLDVISPYYDELSPGQLKLDLDESISVNDAGYVLVEFLINGEVSENTLDLFLDTDLKLVAIYDKVVLIDVKDGKGSGIYRYGEPVFVSAPDKDRVSFLIRDVFDHWVGIDSKSSTIEFEATKDLEITAIYREDYTYMMIMVFLPLCIGSLYMIYKNNTGYKWITHNILDRIASFVPKRKNR